LAEGVIRQMVRSLVVNVRRLIAGLNIKLISIKEVITLGGWLRLAITADRWKQNAFVYLKAYLRRESEESRCTSFGRKGSCGEPSRALTTS
jgi:hypothetical protein